MPRSALLQAKQYDIIPILQFKDKSIWRYMH